MNTESLRKWAQGVSWTMAAGWIAGAVYFGLVLHDTSKVAYCLLSLAGVLAPGIPIATLQSWLQTLGVKAK